MLRWQLQQPELPWETCSVPRVLCVVLSSSKHTAPIITALRDVSSGRQHDPCANLGRFSRTVLTYLSKLPSAEPRSKGECSVLPLSGMERKIDESIHLVKGIPAWKITAQGNVQNLPTVSPLLLPSSSMDRSPNCMIPFVLI